MKKVKFIKDVLRANDQKDKKGSTRVVTTKYAEWLEKQKLADIVGDVKEEKEATTRNTK